MLLSITAERPPPYVNMSFSFLRDAALVLELTLCCAPVFVRGTMRWSLMAFQARAVRAVDKGVPTQHALIVGLASAWDIKGEHLAALDIDQEHAVLIGVVVRDQNGNLIAPKRE
jgi:hypothetical protein